MEANEINQIFKHADPFWAILINKYQSKQINLEQFNLQIYSKITDEPSTYLFPMKPISLPENWFIMSQEDDFDKKITVIYQENLGNFEFLWEAFCYLNKYKLETLAQLFQTQYRLFKDWFMLNGNIEINPNKFNPQNEILNYLRNISKGFRDFCKKLREENKGTIPQFKFFNIKTGESQT